VSPLVTLLTRKGCHLCETAAAELAALRTSMAFDYQEWDVDADSELQSEYGDQVPVVLLNGAMHSYFGVDSARLADAVRMLSADS
jgi:glutaredoxin